LKIRRIRLQNIKSYIDQEVAFHEGVNFISGINGAGKSTLIEAIGYALFDYSPGTISEFIRYGAKSGSITIDFCANDEMEYRVVRKLGTSSLWAVYDLEADGQIDLHGANEVKAWLKDVLGVDKDFDLDQLFQDVIGIPQGTFVGPFLETAAIRKKKFDGILKVEQYRYAFNSMARCANIIKDLIDSKDVEVQIMSVEVKDYDDTKKEKEYLEIQIAQLNKQINEMEKMVIVRNELLNNMDSIKLRLEQALNDKKVVENTINNLYERKKELSIGLNKAEAAKMVLKNSENGYRNYLELEKEIKTLEQQRKTKVKLENEFNRLVLETARIESQIKGQEENLARYAKELLAEKESTALKLQQNGDLLCQAKQKMMAGQDKKIIADIWMLAHKELEKLLFIKEQLAKDINMRKEQSTFLQEEEQSLLKELKQADEIEKKAAQHEAKEKQLAIARQDYEVLKERLRTLEKNLSQLAGGLCPFLESPCQNVQGDLEAHFKTRITETIKEMDILEKSGQVLRQEYEEAWEASKALIAINISRERYTQVLAQKNKLHKEIEAILDSLAVINIDHQIDLLETKSNLKFQRDKDILAQSLAEHASFYKAVESEINFCLSELASLKTEQANLNKSLENQIVKDGQLAKDREKLINDQKADAVLKMVIDEKEKELLPFSNIEGKLENTKNLQAENRNDYETYMQNQGEAGKYEEFAKKTGGNIKDISDHETKLKQLVDLQQELSAAFNNDEYIGLKNELDNLKAEYATQNQALSERMRDFDELIAKIAKMEIIFDKIKVLKKEINTNRKTLELLEIVRGILNNAGPQVAKIYLENLSREANGLYRQISGENAALEWQEGYDVVLADNFHGRQRERSFRQFSGGEQMTAALAIRLALLKQQSRLKIGFFDEPTANLDAERRTNLADTIPRVTGGFHQIFIISHDDTFDSMTDNIIYLQKIQEQGSIICV
jgi:exonuclease SbcC